MNKMIFVTGASRGLGLEICKLFYEKNWNIYGTSTSQEGIDKLKKYCPGAEGSFCDIRNEHQIKWALEDSVKKFSKIDVLVNNAGIRGKGNLEDFSYENIRKVMETNLIGIMNTTKKAIKIMKEQKEGKIINVCSTFGIETSENFSVYCAAKHGLNGFSKSIMKECLKYNINISTLYPGGMNTSFHDSPREQYLNPKEVAEAVYFIATRPQEVLISELVIVPKCEKKYLI